MSFRRVTSAVDRLQVVRPCTESWDEMQGDERVRYCAKCETNVVNLARLTRPEIEALIERTNGHFCSRLVRLPNGLVQTAQDPGSLRFRAARWLSGMAFAASTTFAAESGELRVRAVDATGAVVERAKVTVVDGESKPAAIAETDQTGEANIRDLVPGAYRVEIALVGFATFRQNIQVTDKAVSLLAELKVGSVGGTAVVVESVPLLPRTTTPSSSQSKSKKRGFFGWFR